MEQGLEHPRRLVGSAWIDHGHPHAVTLCRPFIVGGSWIFGRKGFEGGLSGRGRVLKYRWWRDRNSCNGFGLFWNFPVRSGSGVGLDRTINAVFDGVNKVL